MQAPPELAPTIQQLLAFYLEAGVDCALMDEPVNRLADPDAAAPPRETVVREAAGVFRRQSAGAHHVRRRGARARRGHRGPAVRRTLRQASRPDDRSGR